MEWLKAGILGGSDTTRTPEFYKKRIENVRIYAIISIVIWNFLIENLYTICYVSFRRIRKEEWYGKNKYIYGVVS